MKAKATRNVNGAGGVSVSADGRVPYYMTVEGNKIYKRDPTKAEGYRHSDRANRFSTSSSRRYNRLHGYPRHTNRLV